MLVRQGLIVKFTDNDSHYVVIRTSEIAGIYQDRACRIHILLHSGIEFLLDVTEYITFDDVITKIFF